MKYRKVVDPIPLNPLLHAQRRFLSAIGVCVRENSMEKVWIVVRQFA